MTNQDKEQILNSATTEDADLPQKIFGIGLPRTGTSSLGDALKEMGFTCKHFAPELWPNPTVEALRAYDAFIDTPVPSLFGKLDKICVGSKFILTTRNKDAWLSSMDWMLTHGQVIWWWDLRTYNLCKETYGMAKYNKVHFSELYDQFHQKVNEYFKDRPQDLLILDLDKKICTKEIADFLEVEDISLSYPPKGKRVYASLGRRLAYRVYRSIIKTEKLDSVITGFLKKIWYRIKR